MAMPLWRHIYPMTTTVNIPGKGPTALRPQEEFRAPRAVVKHLIKIKRVVGPLSEPPPEPKAEEPKVEAPPAPLPPPQSPKKEEPAPSVKEAEPHGDANDEADVVASESSSATTEPAEETGTQESRTDDGEDKEKETKPRRNKKSKRSRS